MIDADHRVRAMVAGTLLLCALAAGCASAPAAPPAVPSAQAPRPAPAAAPAAPAGAPAAVATTAAAAADELPEGKGKQILLASCTSCHDLREVTKFRGFYTRPQWMDIVLTMVDYGAPVAKTDIEVLADYLAEHLGRRASASLP